MRMILVLVCTFLSGSILAQEHEIFKDSELIDPIKPLKNIGLSMGYNPFPQELLFNAEFRASKRFSPFFALDIGYDSLRSEPVAIGRDIQDKLLYEQPTFIDGKSYYKVAIGYRVNFGSQTGNYNGLYLDLGLQTKIRGDPIMDYYSLISRIGYRQFFTKSLYVITNIQFNLAYIRDNWRPNDSILYLPDFDVDLPHVRIGYQF